MVFVLVSRSRRVVPDELVTLTSWDARDFLIFLHNLEKLKNKLPTEDPREVEK